MTPMELRKPVVAGQFYPALAQDLRNMIRALAGSPGQQRQVMGCILPHAGYIYSGSVAAQTVAAVEVKQTVILLGPNHTGQGKAFSIMPRGIWRTPLGDVEIDSRLAGLFLKRSRHLESDSLAHLQEHSLEVILPILQYFGRDFKIVPIIIGTDDFKGLTALGDDLAAVITQNHLQDSIMFLGSSDLTHYEPQASAQSKDSLVIEAILALDEDRLNQQVLAAQVSMCGCAPVTVLIRALKSLGARSAKLIKYQTSGDSSGDYSSVVGYAGITIS